MNASLVSLAAAGATALPVLGQVEGGLQVGNLVIAVVIVILLILAVVVALTRSEKKPEPGKKTSEPTPETKKPTVDLLEDRPELTGPVEISEDMSLAEIKRLKRGKVVGEKGRRETAAQATARVKSEHQELDKPAPTEEASAAQEASAEAPAAEPAAEAPLAQTPAEDQAASVELAPETAPEAVSDDGAAAKAPEAEEAEQTPAPSDAAESEAVAAEQAAESAPEAAEEAPEQASEPNAPAEEEASHTEGGADATPAESAATGEASEQAASSEDAPAAETTETAESAEAPASADEAAQAAPAAPAEHTPAIAQGAESVETSPAEATTAGEPAGGEEGEGQRGFAQTIKLRIPRPSQAVEAAPKSAAREGGLALPAPPASKLPAPPRPAQDVVPPSPEVHAGPTPDPVAKVPAPPAPAPVEPAAPAPAAPAPVAVATPAAEPKSPQRLKLAVPTSPKAQPKPAETAKATSGASGAPSPAPKSLQEGLKKTRTGFIDRLGSLFKGGELAHDLVEEIEEVLFTADIGAKVANDILRAVSAHLSSDEISDPNAVWGFIRTYCADLLQGRQENIDYEAHKPFVMLVIGVNGVGKTTTIGKIASKLRREGKSVLLVAGDTFRAAAADQLGIWAERTNIPLHRGDGSTDPASVIFSGIERGVKENFDVIICDTAGRLHTKVNLIDELEKIGRVTAKALAGAPHETLLVLDANTGQNAIAQAKLFGEAMPITGIALTKLDGTAKGGVILGICDEVDAPVRYIGIGEGIEDLRAFDADEFVEALFM